MQAFVAEFVTNGIAVIAFCIAGVFGFVSDVAVDEYGIYARAESIPSFSVGGIAFYGYEGRSNLNHERGHLIHSQELGFLYLPIAGLSSFIGNAIGLSGSRYYQMWTERTANEYGGHRW